MNRNRRILSVLLFAVTVLPGLSAETVIDQLFGLRRYELADAYWAAGQKFTDLGQADRGGEFKAQAMRLFPGYVPGQAPKVTAANAAVPAAPAPQVPAVEKVREANVQGEKITRLQFQKLLRGYLTGNAAVIISVLGSSVEVQGTSVTPDKAALEAFLEGHPAEAGSPADLFQTDTLQIADGAGQSVVVTVRANPEAVALADQVPFWKDQQEYVFDRVEDTWKLVKVSGQ